MLYILHGEDDYSLQQWLKQIKQGAATPDLLSANTTVLDGEQVSSAQLNTVCETVPFLSEKRLVIVNGLLERFEAKGKSRGNKKKKPAVERENELDTLAKNLANLPDSTEVVLVDEKITTNNPLLKELSAAAQIKHFPLLKGRELRPWIQQRVSAEGGTISPQAVDLLAALIGNNLWIMSSEINKLVLLNGSRRIEETGVRLTVGYAQEANIFAIVDAILEARPGRAAGLLQRLLQQGASPTYPLFMLSRQLRLIIQAGELKKQGKPGPEIQRRLGLPSEFALRRTLEQANRNSLPRIKRVYDKLLATDLTIKTGKLDAELALNILIAELGP